MAPTYRSITHGNDNTIQNRTITAPSGLADDDIILVFDFHTGDYGTISGFTATNLGTNGDGVHATALHKIASSEGSSWTCNHASSGNSAYVCIAVRPGAAGTLSVVQATWYEGGNGATSYLRWATAESGTLGGAAGDSYYTAGMAYFDSRNFDVESGFTELLDDGELHAAHEDDISAANTDVSHPFSSGAPLETTGIGFTIRETGATATLDQEGYRIYDDDADPSGSPTALAAQDTAVTDRAVTDGTQIRILIDSTNNPDPNAYKLQHNYSGDSADLYEDTAT